MNSENKGKLWPPMVILGLLFVLGLTVYFVTI